jgi:hypothetical protein
MFKFHKLQSEDHTMRPNLLLLLALIFTASVRAQGAPPVATVPVVILSSGLEASLPSGIGRTKEGYNVTVALKLENKGKAAVALALVGPTPVAVDNAGTTYSMTSFSGSGACSELTVIALPACILGEEKGGQKIPIPLQAFTQIDPGASAIVTFGLNGRQGTGNQLSFSSVFAYRLIADPLTDDALSENDRRRQIRTMSVSFPPFPVTTQK